jgi:general stress protein 26
MNKDEIVERARSVIADEQKAFIMATVSADGEPHVRWMGAAVATEPMTLHLLSGRESRKVEDIAANPNVELLFSRGDFSEVVAVSGPAELADDDKTKEMVFDAVPVAGDYFSGPEDPNLAVIRMTVKRLRLWPTREQHEPEVAEL